MKKLLLLALLISGCAGMKEMGTKDKPDPMVLLRCHEHPESFHYVHREDIKKYSISCPKKK